LHRPLSLRHSQWDDLGASRPPLSWTTSGIAVVTDLVSLVQYQLGPDARYQRTRRLGLCRRRYSVGYRSVGRSQRAATTNYGGLESGTLGSIQQSDISAGEGHVDSLHKTPRLAAGAVPVVVKGQLTNESRHLKILGVTFDHRLRQDVHVAYVAKRAFARPWR